MVNNGVPAQWARSVLPNSLKTEIVVTANIREWRHFFRLRAACETGMPHPQMLEVAVPLFQEMQIRLPELFNDIVIPDDVLKQYGKTFFVPSAQHDDQIEGQITIEELLNEQQSN
jgi:thymidylate synthase ThyX